MTINQAALAKYFKSRGNEWRSTAEVIGWMTSPLVDGYPQPDSFLHLHDSTARRKLSKDIQALNDDPDFDGIIINGVNGYKLATKEEAVAYLRAEVIEAAKRMKRYHGMCRKAGLHGQLDLEGNLREILIFTKEDK